MEQQEWQNYVQKILTCAYPIPPHLISNYEDWKCRSVVGRMLLILKDVEGAMAVLATVKDVQPDLEDAPEYGLSEAEHKVLCLRDIAEIIWKLTGTIDAPLLYLAEASRLCREYRHVFRSADRGAVWVRRLELLRESGQGERAVAEAKALLAEANDTAEVDPYRFHAYKFLAESMAAQGDYAKGALLIAEGYRYFPLSEAGKQDLAAAAAVEDAKERYEQYHRCTGIQYQPWEKDNVPTIEEVRELQYRNFLKREGDKEQNGEDLISQLK